MMANAAFLAALVLFLLVGWLAGEVRFLAPHKAALFREHGAIIVGVVGRVSEPLCRVLRHRALVLSG
jgi:hypothetical protein